MNSLFAGCSEIRFRVGILLPGLFLVALPSAETGRIAAAEKTSAAAAEVRAGLRAFDKQDFTGAIARFERALKLLPDDQRVQFNLGCALRDAGETVRAERMFVAAANGPDVVRAADAQSSLGLMLVQQARLLIGEPAEDAERSKRDEGIRILDQAVARFRSAIELNPDHEGARRNLELLRVWMKTIRELWVQRDLASDGNEDPVSQLQLLIVEVRDVARDLGESAFAPPGMARHRDLMELVHRISVWKPRLLQVQTSVRDRLSSVASGQPEPVWLRELEGASESLDSLVQNLRGKRLDEAAAGLVEIDRTCHAALRLLAAVGQQLNFARDLQAACRDWTRSLSSDTPTGPWVRPQAQHEQECVGRILESVLIRTPLELDALPGPAVEEDSSKLTNEAEEQPDPVTQYRALLERVMKLGGDLPKWSEETTDHLVNDQTPSAVQRQTEIIARLDEILQNQPPPSGESDSQKDEQSSDEQSSDESSPPESGKDDSGSPGEDTKRTEDREQSNGDDQSNDDRAESETANRNPQAQENDAPADGRLDSAAKDHGQNEKQLTSDQVEVLLQKVRERERYRDELEKRLRNYLQLQRRARRDW